MHTLFISDLHLSPERPEITRLLLHFLQNDAPKADALYILGDLFEYWIGDDDKSEFNQAIIHALSQLSIPTFFMHGNRDLLIGKRFAKQANCTLLADPTVIDLYGERILLMHGDTLCTDDHDYIRYRKIAHNWFVQKGFLALPLRLRTRIVNWQRGVSKAHTSTANKMITDVNQTAVETVMQAHQIQTLIHGHTHRPACHEFTLNNLPAKRYVLASWENQGHVLICQDDGSKKEQCL